MAKRIQVSSVKMEADVQVINLNTSFVARAIRAKCALDQIADANHAEYDAMVHAYGEEIEKSNEWHIWDVKLFQDTVKDFIDDLCTALEGEDE